MDIRLKERVSVNEAECWYVKTESVTITRVRGPRDDSQPTYIIGVEFCPRVDDERCRVTGGFCGFTAGLRHPAINSTFFEETMRKRGWLEET